MLPGTTQADVLRVLERTVKEAGVSAHVALVEKPAGLSFSPGGQCDHTHESYRCDTAASATATMACAVQRSADYGPCLYTLHPPSSANLTASHIPIQLS